MMHFIVSIKYSVLCSMQLCYRLNLLTIDLLIKTWFYAVVCKFTTLILSFEVWGLGLGLDTVGLVNITAQNQDFNVTPLFNAKYLRNGTRYRVTTYNVILIRTYVLLESVISNDLEWLSEIVNDTKHRAVSLRQLSSLLVNQLESGLARDMLTSCRLQSNCTVMLETETMFHDNRLTQSTKNSPKFGHVRAYATYLQRNKLSICWSFMKRDPGPWPIRWYKQILENQPIS